MALNLPPDPYKILGVSKDAQPPDIRSAYRKLVLKCHPDKVQDAALKAIKQDEFQQVQQAYELLSDERRRQQYEDMVKLFELRKDLGRGGNPSSTVNPFDFQIPTADSRPSNYTRSKPAPPQPKVYTEYPPRSYEDAVHEESVRTSKKSTSYKSADRKGSTSARDSPRDSDRQRYEDEDAARQRWEKETKRAAHGEKKKSRDKEKRRATEEKHSKSHPYVEDNSDDYQAPQSSSREKLSSKYRMEEEIRLRNEAAAAANARATKETRQAPLTPKWDEHKTFAAEYMQAARRKVPATDEFHPGPMRRAETFAGSSYNIRHVSPHSPHSPNLSPSDDEAPRRSSARSSSRRVSEAQTSRRDTPKKERKRSPSARAREPYVVEPPPPTPSVPKPPKLQTHSSAPPLTSVFAREKPSRAKTQDYPRGEQAVPSLPRAKTFQSGEREHGRDRERDRGSRLKKSVNYDSDHSDSDSPVYGSPRHSRSPPRRSEAKKTVYTVDKGRTVPAPRHRSDVRNIDDEDYHTRDRSESVSPRTGRHAERPPLSRNGGGSGSRQAPQRSHSQVYYADAEPVIHTAHHKIPSREPGPHRNGSSRGPYFGEVKYSPNYGEHVVYSPPVPSTDAYRRGSEPSYHDRDQYHAPYPPRNGREVLYT